jgi:hypothetical protein
MVCSLKKLEEKNQEPRDKKQETRLKKVFIVCSLWFVVKKEVRSTRYEVRREESGMPKGRERQETRLKKCLLFVTRQLKVAEPICENLRFKSAVICGKKK